MQKNGISLIVLVITIIVMIILAASVVISLSNTGIIDRAGKAVDLTNEASVQDLAALTWADAYMAGKRGTELESDVTTKLSEQGVTAEKWNITISDTGVVVKSKSNSSNEESLATKYNWTTTGTCGTGVNYGFDSTTGTLGIWGTGSMVSTSRPWEDVKTEIQTVIIEEGVTTIDSSAFMGCSSLKNITIPGSVTAIRNNAFYNCSSLENVQYLGLLEPIVGTGAFSGVECTIQVPQYYEVDSEVNTFGGLPVNKVL